jgi:hypothetical protein
MVHVKVAPAMAAVAVRDAPDPVPETVALANMPRETLLKLVAREFRMVCCVSPAWAA